MKRIILTLSTLAFVCAVTAGSAQARPPHGQGNPADRLTSMLHLDEAQTTEVRTIFEEARSLHDEVRDQSHKSFCSIRAQTDERLKEVLNDDQRLQFAELQTRRAERPQEDRSDANTPKRDRGQGGNRRGQQPGGMDARRQGPPPDCNA